VAKGDRIQFTAPAKESRIANREQATVQSIDSHGRLQVALDSGRKVHLSSAEAKHIDYGYAVTSYSSQGLTARRVLIHVDSAQSRQLVNERYAYVAVSRGSHDSRIYTDNARRLSQVLSRGQEKTSATEEWNRHTGSMQHQPVQGYERGGIGRR